MLRLRGQRASQEKRGRPPFGKGKRATRHDPPPKRHSIQGLAGFSGVGIQGGKGVWVPLWRRSSRLKQGVTLSVLEKKNLKETKHPLK